MVDLQKYCMNDGDPPDEIFVYFNNCQLGSMVIFHTYPGLPQRVFFQFQFEVLFHDAIVGMTASCVMAFVDNDEREVAHVNFENPVPQNIDQNLEQTEPDWVVNALASMEQPHDNFYAALVSKSEYLLIRMMTYLGCAKNHLFRVYVFHETDGVFCHSDVQRRKRTLIGLPNTYKNGIAYGYLHLRI